jgi:hypothetical protein
MRTALLAVAVQTAACGAWGQVLSDAVKEKVDPAVVSRAVAGTSQRASVTLDDDDIDRRGANMRAAKGLTMNDSEVNAFYRREYERLREEVFPGGALGNIPVISYSPDVPQVTVHFTGMASLARLAEHPRVKYVHDDYRIYRVR